MKDLLNRGPYINFLKNLIKNANNYKRNDESNSYIMAIDSAWGTGKTSLIELLCEGITKNENNIEVINYNAWKNDYCSNAFEPLFYEIVNSDVFINSLTKENILDLGKAAATTALAFAADILKIKKNIDIDNTLESVKNDIYTVKDLFTLHKSPLAKHKAEKDSFDKLKKIISTSSFFDDKRNKLVIIIDELDRCKPTFAIQTLEVVKHIFDIENVVFIFAVDIEQLSHCVESVYGNNINATGYLNRFFDYISKIPTPNVVDYIAHKLEAFISDFDFIVSPEVEKNLSSSRFPKSKHPTMLISRYINDLADMFSLSLREIDTLLQSYKIIFDNFLNQYYHYDAHRLYLFLLCLKYKNITFFNLLFSGNPTYQQNLSASNEQIYEYMDGLYFLKQLLRTDNKPLEHKSFTMYSISNKAIKSSLVISKVSGSAIAYDAGFNLETIEIDQYINLNNLLYYPDIIKWEDIKLYTLKQYLHHQLEMYNFLGIE